MFAIWELSTSLKFIDRTDTGTAAVAWDDLRRCVRYAVRFLDDVIDAAPYFLDENAEQQKGSGESVSTPRGSPKC
ncbi:MAG: hypothetical protein ACREDR_39235 [Blastocatellia bacterium]